MLHATWFILIQAALLVVLFTHSGSCSPAHGQRVRRSADTDGWSDCSKTCGTGQRTHLEYRTIDCHTFSCDFKPACTCGRADIVFVVDHSLSIGDQNYFVQKQFMLDIVSALKRLTSEESTNFRISVVSFGREETVEFDFNDGFSVDDFEPLADKIWAMPYRKGNTNTQSALVRAKELFTTQGSVGQKRITVVLTDGGSNINSQNTIPAAKDLHQIGAFVYAIGIGAANVDEMRGIASDPAELFYFYSDDYDGLSHIVEEVLNGTCCYSTETQCVTTAYQQCSVSCGEGGVRTATVTCTYTNYLDEIINVEERQVIESCPFIPCEPVCQTAGPFGPCSVTCGGGARTQTQTCTYTDETGMVQTLTNTVTEPCCTAPCPPDKTECSKCDYTNGVGYLVDDARCSCFYQCQRVGTDYRIHHKCCAAGLLWSADKLTCDWPTGNTCTNSEYAVCDANEITTTTTTVATSACIYQSNPGNSQQFMYNGAVVGTCVSGLIWSTNVCACIYGQNIVTPQLCDNDILLYFPFDDDLNDASCTHAHADNNGGVELKASSGRKGGAAYFRGDNFLSVEFLNNWFAGKDVTAWTVALWYKPTGHSTSVAGLVNNGDCERAPSWTVFIGQSNEASAALDTDGTTAPVKLSSTQVPSDTWTHVTMVYNGYQLVVFKNGQRLSNAATVTGAIENRQCPMNIGHEAQAGAANSGYFTGYMDEIRVYERTLNDWEVQNLYTNP